MTSIKKRYRSNWTIPVVILPPLTAIGLWLALSYHSITIVGSLAFLITCSWMVSRFRLQSMLLQIITAFLPFSFEVALTDNIQINVPSEPLLVIAIFTMGWDILRKPGLLKQLMGQETIWILPLLSSIIITSCFSTITWVSVKFTMVSFTYILVFFIWQKHLFRLHPNLFLKLIKLYSFSFLLVILYAIFRFKEYEWNPVTIRGIFQPFFKDNTIFGATSALLASFWLLYKIKVRTLTFKMLYLLLGFSFAAGVVLSTSRAAALSLIFFILVWIILQLRIRLRQMAIIFVSFIVLVGIFRNSFYHLLLENKYESHNAQGNYTEQIKSSGNISSDISNIERLNRWVAGLRMFAEKPYTGFGPGTYQFVYIPYQAEKFKNRLTVKDPWHIPENSGGTAHSEYVLAISEMGILGILSLLLLLGRWIWIAFEKARFHPQRTTIIIAFAVLSTYLFHSLFNNFLTTDKFAFLFWGTAAWMLAHFERKADEQQNVL